MSLAGADRSRLLASLMRRAGLAADGGDRRQLLPRRGGVRGEGCERGRGVRDRLSALDVADAGSVCVHGKGVRSGRANGIQTKPTRVGE